MPMLVTHNILTHILRVRKYPYSTMSPFLQFIDLRIFKIQRPIVFGKLLKVDMLALILAQSFESLVFLEVLIY